jgi:predicted phage terminase large subunit-like protein
MIENILHTPRARYLATRVSKNLATLSEINEFQELINFANISSYRSYVMALELPIDWQWFHYDLMDIIDDILESKISRRLMVFLPPRHCKTLLCGQLLSTYIFGRFQDKEIVYATAVEEKAEEELDKVRSTLVSDKYRELFPDIAIKSGIEDISEIDKRIRKSKKDTATTISNLNSVRGKYTAVGRGNMLTGKAAHISIADDLYKDFKDASSDKIRDSIWKWFTMVFSTRVDKPRLDSVHHMILFFTRWHDMDVCGELLRIQAENENETLEREQKHGIKVPRWEVFSYEAIKTERTYKLEHGDGNPLSDIPGMIACSQSDPRELGEPLWPKYHAEYIVQQNTDPKAFEAMYQANPQGAMSRIFEESYFTKRYTNIPPDLVKILISIDPNLKDSKDCDDAAFSVWGLRANKDVFLLEFTSKPLNYQTLKLETMRLINKYRNYHAVLVENKANGVALTSDLKTRFSRVLEFNPGSASKEERARIVLPFFIAGNVYLPDRSICPNIDKYVNIMLGFTGKRGGKDDLVDSTVMALMYYMQTSRVLGVENIQRIPRNANGGLQISGMKNMLNTDKMIGKRIRAY